MRGWCLRVRLRTVDTSVGRGVVVWCCLTSALLLERRSFDLDRPRDSTCSSSHQTHSSSACTRDLGGRLVLKDVLLVSRVSLVSHTSLVPHVSLVALVSERQFQGIRELFRFICGQLLVRCQVALVLDEELVDTVGDMLVDLALHVGERFLVCDIVVMMSRVLASVEHVPRDLELKRVVQHCRGLVEVVA